MLSTPAPIPISIMPVLIWLMTSMQACRPEEHWRFRVRTAVVSGKPATRAAARISVAPPPGARTVPTAISSTRAGSILERSRSDLRAPAIRSEAWVSLNPPLPPLVKGVRRAAVTTTWEGQDALDGTRKKGGLLVVTYIVRVLLQNLLLVAAGAARKLTGQLRQSLNSCNGWCCQYQPT